MDALMKILCFYMAIIQISRVQLSPLPQKQDGDVAFNWTENENTDDGPASKCQDIYEKDKNSPSGYYNIIINGQISKVYCYFHNPQVTTIRQLYSLDGKPQEWNVHIPADVNNGDPEGAMEMQYELGDIPEGVDTHFTQPIIDHQETLYYNKTLTIQKLIDLKNKSEREKHKQEKKP